MTNSPLTAPLETATDLVASKLLTPELTHAVVSSLTRPWPLFLLATLLIVSILGLRKVGPFRRLGQTKAERRHQYNQKRSRADLELIRSMVPLENPGRVFAYLRKVDPYRFEEMILSELERRQIRITRSRRYSGDGGIDGQFFHEGELWLIQAKRYSNLIKPDHVWTFEAICQRSRARGLFVHTGKTPKRLRSMDRQCGLVRIISGQELLKLFAGHAVSLEPSQPQPAEQTTRARDTRARDWSAFRADRERPTSPGKFH
jgi:restriction system protein